MNGFLSWFKGNTKLKRWIILILIGIIFSCYGFANVLVINEMTFENMAKIIGIFVVGFTAVIVGLIYIQKRTLELMIEAEAVNKPNGNLDIRALIFNKNVYNKGPKIVVIGGGTGLVPVLNGLKKYTSNLTAITTISDYGDDVEIIKEKSGLMPLKDVKNAIIGLSSNPDIMKKLLNYKFDDNPTVNITFADIYIETMRNINENFIKSIEISNDILNISGNIIPVTDEKMEICIELKDGTIIKKKDKIKDVVGERVSPVNRVFVNPTNARPTPSAIQAIKEADAIVIGPR